MKIKKNKTLKDKIYDKVIEYRPVLIKTMIYIIPIIYILYVLNIHGYIYPKAIGNSVIFRLDIYYRYFALIFAFMHFYELYYTKEKPNLIDCFLYLFLGMTLVSSIFAHNFAIAIFGYPNRFEGLFTLLFYGFLYLNCKKIKDTNYVLKMSKIIIFYAFVQFFTVILQLTGLFSKVIYMYTSGAAIGLTENCNFLASLMCMLCMITCGAYILKIEKKNIYYLIAFIISYITLLLANSTGPFLSFVATFIIFVIYGLIKKCLNKKNMLVIILLMIVLYPIVLNNTDGITPEIKSHISYFINKIQISDDTKEEYNNEEYNSEELTFGQLGHGRVTIWKNVWKVIKKRPLLGYGPDNLGLVYEKGGDLINGEDLIADKAHNIYLHIWSSSGIFAVIGYLGFVILNIKESLKSKSPLILCLIFGVIAYSVQGLFNINVSEVTPYFYIILGLTFSLTVNENLTPNTNN